MPVAIVATVVLVALWRVQQAQLHDSMRATAHAVALSLEQRIDGTLRLLRLLASLERPQASPEWGAGVLVLPAGEHALAHRRRVFEGEAAVSDLFFDGPNVPMVEVGVPVMREGRVAYGLFARLEPKELSELMRSQLGDPAGIAGIVDGDYRIIARTRDADAFIGKRPLAPLDAAVRAAPSGVGRFPVRDAPLAYSAWTRVGGTGWTVIMGTPAAPIDAALKRSLGALAALLGIVLAASLLFAWLIGRRASRIEEVRTLMEALERSSSRLAAAEEERERAESSRDSLVGEERRGRALAEAASRAKDEFLAMLGHELRNPLGAIANAVRVIERAPIGSGDHKAAREIIARQTEHLGRIIDNVLDVGRMASGRIVLRRNLVDLAQAAAATVAAVRAGQLPAEHEWQLDLRPVLVSADPTRVDQMLAGLFGNAARFTPPGGTIRVALHEQAGEALLGIEDGGPGIEPELLPHILEQGMRLNLVRRLVELHGGSLEVANRAEGNGARFTVRLPAIPEPEPLGQRSGYRVPSPRPSRQARVLIVEDNDDARIMLQRILQSDGHLVSAARDARAGLEAAGAGSPNVALVDIGLPGMDGYQFARALRERLGNGVRLIALTGYGSDSDRLRAAEAGFDAHLTKPVDMDRLLALVNEAG